MESHDKIKRAIELAGSADDQELFELLVGLREDIARLRDDNIQLKERSGELQRQLNEKQEVVVDRQSIWRKKPDGTLV
jgi:hypothetical protein